MAVEILVIFSTAVQQIWFVLQIFLVYFLKFIVKKDARQFFVEIQNYFKHVEFQTLWETLKERRIQIELEKEERENCMIYFLE